MTGPERLAVLSAYLRELAADASQSQELGFDLREWYEETDCGTTACAVGHAWSIPELADEGLESVRSERMNGVRLPRYRGEEGFLAARLFFDLSHGVVNKIFDSCHYAENELEDPAAVADRIDAYLAELAAQEG